MRSNPVGQTASQGGGRVAGWRGVAVGSSQPPPTRHFNISLETKVTSECGLTSPRDGGALPTYETFGAGSASTLLFPDQTPHTPVHSTPRRTVNVHGKQRRRRPRLRQRPGDTCATASRNDLSGSTVRVTTGYDNCDSSHCMFLVDRWWLPSGVSGGRSHFLPLASEPFRALARRRS